MDPIEYSDKYQDDTYEYRHVILPRDLAAKIPGGPRLLSEQEWRSASCYLLLLLVRASWLSLSLRM